MKKLILLTLIGCSQTTTPLDAGTPAVAQPDVPKHPGERTYIMYCTSCHGYDGTGLNGLGADFVNDKAILAQTDGALLQSIFEGKGRMPPGKNILNVEQALNVIDYIRLSFGEK
jgi:mono/diheme cytochrome c family protein